MLEYLYGATTGGNIVFLRGAPRKEGRQGERLIIIAGVLNLFISNKQEKTGWQEGVGNGGASRLCRARVKKR